VLWTSYVRRLTEIQGEMATWGGVHARIWEPFGPHGQTSGTGTGVGGMGQLGPAADPLLDGGSAAALARWEGGALHSGHRGPG
jgi:hypothetical protein